MKSESRTPGGVLWRWRWAQGCVHDEFARAGTLSPWQVACLMATDCSDRSAANIRKDGGHRARLGRLERPRGRGGHPTK